MGTPIYVDFSLLDDFTCEEKIRLKYVEHLRPKELALAPSFGGALHDAIAQMYRLRGQGLSADRVIDGAKLAALQALRDDKVNIPIPITDIERRSVERCMNLIEAYVARYEDELYEPLVREGTREPYVEIGFLLHIMDYPCDMYEGECDGTPHPVMLVGRIDRIMRCRTTGGITLFDTKTSRMNVPSVLAKTRPNHQITIYWYACETLLNLKVSSFGIDAVYISDRQPNPKKGPWMGMGIDLEADFGRAFTIRSPSDIEEVVSDIHETAKRLCDLRHSRRKRWTRNSPGSCFTYGKCQYLDLCSSNLNPALISSTMEVKPWEPWAIKEATTRGKLGPEDGSGDNPRSASRVDLPVV